MPKVIPEYKEEAKKKIIAAGHEVMIKKGYRAATLDDIAEYVGVSKTTLYLYFKNKDDLVLEIVKAFPEIREKKVSEYPATSPFDYWTAVLDFYLDNSDEENALYYEFLSMVPTNPEIAKCFSGNLSLELERMTNGITKQQMAGKVYRDADPRSIALVMMGLFNSIRALSLSGVKRDELRTRWIEMGKILFGYQENRR